MKKSKGITIFEPKPFQNVGPEFKVVGIVSKSWLEGPWEGHTDDRLFIDYIDIDGQAFMCTTLFVQKNFFLKFFKKYFFGQLEKFNSSNVSFIERSQGRITLKIAGHKDKEHAIYIPLAIKEFEPENGVDPSIAERHPRIGEIVTQYEQDLQTYYAEKVKIDEARKEKNGGKEPGYLHGPDGIGIAHDIFQILDESDECFEEYEYSEDDDREKALDEKFAAAIKWRGPLVRGLISQFGEFELRTYSDDHDQHFHVIHKGKRINARFSFPGIQLISYKNSRNTITSKQESRIRAYCQRPEIHQRLENWFQRRGV